MTDPKQQQLTFSLALGHDTVAEEENVQPSGGVLRAARNCRLSSNGQSLLKQPACTQVVARTATGCGGIVPLTSEDSNVVLSWPSSGLRRATGAAETGLKSLGTFGGDTAQSNFVAARVYSRVVPAGECVAPGATCVDGSGNVYTAQVDRNGTLLVTVSSAAGELLIAPTPITGGAGLIGSIPGWVGLTTHLGAVYLWWTSGSTLYKETLSISGLDIVVGTFAAVSGVTADPSINFISSHDGQYAFLVAARAADDQVRQYVIDPATGAATASLLTTTGDPIQVHCAAYVSGGVTNISVFVGTVTNSYWFLSDGGLLVLETTSWAESFYGYTAFATQSYSDYPSVSAWAVLARTSATGEVVAGGEVGMIFTSRPFGGGALIAGGEINVPWMRCLAATTWVVSPTEAYALFAATPCYSGGSIPFPTEPNYVIDPSIAVFLTRAPRKAPDVTPIARLGVDSAVARPKDFFTAPHMGTLVCSGQRAYFNYLARRNTPVDATFTVGTVIDFSSHQTHFALASRSATTVATGMPASWDGVELTEVGFLFSPRVIRNPGDSGTGPGSLPQGTHSFVAVWTWRDVQGDLHRSYPSPVCSVEIANVDGQDVTLYVTQPAAMRNSTSMFGVSLEVYQTETDGTVFYRQDYTATYVSDFFVSVAVTGAGEKGAEHPILFTTGGAGQPLPPITPPAAVSGCVVGDRCFLISAEQPDEVWPSHKKDIGIAWEWSAEVRVKFPASAGNLVAALESSGVPVFLSDRGVWSLSGDGPNRMLIGSFSQPQQQSNIPCTDGNSALSTPVGIIYRSGNRFANASKGLDPRMDLSPYNIVSAYLDTDNQEAVWVTQEQVALVYAYAADQWRTWVIPTTARHAAWVPRSKQVLLYNGASLQRLDVNSVDSTQQLSFETGWVLLGDLQDDNQIQDIVFQAKRASSHGVRLQIKLDYQDAIVLDRAFTASEVTSLAANGRYTLMISPKTMSCRAIKVIVTETNAAGTALQPIGVTLVFGKLPGTLRSAVLRQGRK